MGSFPRIVSFSTRSTIWSLAGRCRLGTLGLQRISFSRQKRYILQPRSCHLTRAIFALPTARAKAITRRRESTIARWTCRAAELRSQEDSRLRSLHPDVQKVIGPGADAVTAIHEEGVLLFDPCPEFHCFPRRGRRALKDIKELRRAPWVQAKVSGAARGSSDASVDRSWSDKSMLEVSLGFTRGLFTLSVAREKFGKDFVPCRTFPVAQKGKVRLADDFSESGHNTTTSNIEAVDMGGVGAVAGLAKTWVSSVKPGGLVKVKLEKGSTKPFWLSWPCSIHRKARWSTLKL